MQNAQVQLHHVARRPHLADCYFHNQMSNGHLDMDYHRLKPQIVHISSKSSMYPNDYTKGIQHWAKMGISLHQKPKKVMAITFGTGTPRYRIEGG